MADELRIRELQTGDLEFANRVREQAGWNQTLADWRRFMALAPDGCFLADLNGEPAGTATTTIYGDSELAWIGMVLVDEKLRRRGVGTALLEHAIRYLRDTRRVACIKLDATPAGQPLYEKLGFVAEWGLQRWHAAEAPPIDAVVSESPEVTGASLSPELLAFDEKAFGADRGDLLRSLVEGSTATCIEGNSYGILRPGWRASYLGPLVSSDWSEARPLLEGLLARAPSGSIFWDIPDQQVQAAEEARSLGFEPVRRLVRMALDGAKIAEDPACVFGIAEPGLG